jgi:choline kinase
MKVKNAVICAAGIGSRLELDMPKCLVEVNGHKIIYYLLKVLENVPNIRVVVGFKEEEVIDYVRSIRKDVVFVRNQDYRSTSNSYSLYLGSRDLKEPFINIDGDNLITKENFQKFVDAINPKQELIGVTRSYTEDAVFTRLDEQGRITEFSREKISEYEWTGVAYFANIKIRKEGKYIYQELISQLPTQACIIECFEVDTPQDLEYVSKNFKFNV